MPGIVSWLPTASPPSGIETVEFASQPRLINQWYLGEFKAKFMALIWEVALMNGLRSFFRLAI